jgi:hypothetical protein
VNDTGKGSARFGLGLPCQFCDFADKLSSIHLVSSLDEKPVIVASKAGMLAPHHLFYKRWLAESGKF